MEQQHDKPLDYFKNHGIPVKDTLTNEQIEFEELCYKIFILNEDGQQLVNLLKDRYIMKRLVANYDPIEMAFREGYKEAFRDLLTAANNCMRRTK